MKHKVFAIYDSQVTAFLSPFVAQHPSLAKRSFQAVANDGTSQISTHPQDFTLFEVGEWDDDSGRLIPYERHINHGLATNYKERKPNGGSQGSSEQISYAAPVRPGPQGGNTA